jgi:hypothetical protein
LRCEHVFVTRAKQPPPKPWVVQKGRPSGTGKRPIERRDCPRHGRTEFALYGSGSARYRWRCKRCVGEAVTRRHQKVKRILVAENGGCCALCGYDRAIINLQFHHVDPSTKSFQITGATGKSLRSYRDEAKKCVLVCANCHGEIEGGLVSSPPPGTTYWDSIRREPPPPWFFEILDREAVGPDASPRDIALRRALELVPYPEEPLTSAGRAAQPGDETD